MIIPTHLGLAGPLWRAQMRHARAFDRLVSLDLIAVDLRFAFASAVARPLSQAADALVHHLMSRAWRGARFAEDITAAATMMAAARH